MEDLGFWIQGIGVIMFMFTGSIVDYSGTLKEFILWILGWWFICILVIGLGELILNFDYYTKKIKRLRK